MPVSYNSFHTFCNGECTTQTEWPLNRSIQQNCYWNNPLGLLCYICCCYWCRYSTLKAGLKSSTFYFFIVVFTIENPRVIRLDAIKQYICKTQQCCVCVLDFHFMNCAENQNIKTFDVILFLLGRKKKGEFWVMMPHLLHILVHQHDKHRSAERA